MISAKVILDSINPYGDRLTTIEYVGARCVLAEINTHRAFSRNTGSSRAIPVLKIIESVEKTPYIPQWTRNQPGMVGVADFTRDELDILTALWLDGRDRAVDIAKLLNKKKAHKQHVNRILEPYLFYKGIISSTDYQNFINLREDEDADPAIATLATKIRECLENSTPKLLEYGEWHLPYVDTLDIGFEDAKNVSAARCARVSYKTFDSDKDSDLEADLALVQKLRGRKPHMSPFEHQARADCNDNSYYWGNFKGWAQNRKLIECQ